MRSNGAVREFLDDAVDDEVLVRVLDSARFAPSGGNRQAWRVVVVQDPALRRRLGELYLPGLRKYLAHQAAGLQPFSPLNDPDAERAAELAAPEPDGPVALAQTRFANELERVPALLVILVDLRVVAVTDKYLDRPSVVGGASVYPFVQNVLLAARAEGLGGVLTTFNVHAEPEIRPLLGIPPHLAMAAVLALGRPCHRPARLRRDPVEAFTTVDRVDGRPLGVV